MCNNTMPPLDCTSKQVASDLSPSTSFHDGLSDDDDDECCGKSGSSLEDTLSLTCDESMSSTMSSSPSVDNTMDDSSDSEVVDIYQSPHILRRRLLPLPPSPIAEPELDIPIYNEPSVTKALVRKRPSTRFVWLTLSLVAYLFVTTVDYRWLIESLREKGYSKENQEWRRFLRRKAPKILKKLPSKSANREYTIRIKGHRLDLIMQSLDYHAQCPSVKQVQVDWTGKSTSLPKPVKEHHSGKVTEKTKSTTPALFLLDEDIVLACDEIERAFQEWRLDPTRLVGFYPFHHDGAAGAGEDNRANFHLQPVSQGAGSYSMVSDRAVFVHNLILRSLPSVPKACQHLSMSIIVSSITSKPPVAVVSNPQTFRQSKRKSKADVPKEVNASCRRWIESIGSSTLPNEFATIVGHQNRPI